MAHHSPDEGAVLQVDQLALRRGEQRQERLTSFQVSAGEVVTIAGANGSGKSVLLSCLAGQRVPTHGGVRVLGFDLFNRRQRAKVQPFMGVVFQNPGLVRTLSVFDNVALPFLVDSLKMTPRLEQRIRLRLRLVGCENLAEENPENLSAGERRCVAVARALSGRSRILFADEPVAELSSEKRLMIEELISSLVKTRALDAAILFTQDPELADRLSSRLITLNPPDPEDQSFGGLLNQQAPENVPYQPQDAADVEDIHRRKQVL